MTQSASGESRGRRSTGSEGDGGGLHIGRGLGGDRLRGWLEGARRRRRRARKRVCRSRVAGGTGDLPAAADVEVTPDIAVLLWHQLGSPVWTTVVRFLIGLPFPVREEGSDERDNHGKLVEQDESPCSRVRVDERNRPAESLGDVQERDGPAELPDVQ